MPGEPVTESLTPPVEETTTSLATEGTTTEETTTETESSTEAAGDPPAPTEEYVPLTAEDIAFPEGVEVNEELRDEALTIINDREKSPKEQLQALIDLQVKAANAASEASSKAWTDMQTSWRDEVKADPVVGGDKLQPALGRIGRLLSEYGSDEVTKVLDLTGAGNNVHLIKMLDKVASKLVEGGPVVGAPTNQTSTAAERMFPSMKGSN